MDWKNVGEAPAKPMTASRGWVARTAFPPGDELEFCKFFSGFLLAKSGAIPRNLVSFSCLRDHCVGDSFGREWVSVWNNRGQNNDVPKSMKHQNR
ncbi:MAG: hypothetical protein KC643_15805 [Nitrospira sp.]|nr:hypothetical protein [Nitrospira sp.]